MITYQIQPSTLSPEGTSEPYGRYSVILQGSQSFALPTTLDAIATILKEGKSVDITCSDGVAFSLLPTLSGGFTIAESPTPTAASIGIGVKPSKGLLASTRFEAAFNRAETTFRQPAIITMTSWYQNSPYDGLVFNGTHSSYVEITGTNLKLDPTNLRGKFTGGSLTDYVMLNEQNLITWTNTTIAWLEKSSLSEPPAFPATGVFTLSSGDRSVSLTVSCTDVS